MKYVKRISLFFVYPICMLLMGIWIGNSLNEDANTPAKLQENIAENIEIEEYTEQYVMNHEAVAEIDEVTLPQAKEGFFVCLKDDCVVVYMADRETIFLSTQIRYTELPEHICEELKSGIYMSDEGMLYGFLENYTS